MRAAPSFTGFNVLSTETVDACGRAAGRAPLLLIAMLTVVWGTNWTLFAMALQEVSVWTFRAINLMGAGLALLTWCRCTGRSVRVPRKYWLPLVGAAFVYLGIWNIASTYAAVMIPSGQAAILGFTMPLWAVLGSRIFFGERMERRSVMAVSIGGVGVLLLVAKGWRAYAEASLGFGLGLLAGLAWAAGTLLLKRWPVPLHGAVVAGWQMLCVGVPFAFVALVKGTHQWFMPSGTTILVIAYITLVPMAFGTALWFTIVNRVPTHVAALSPVLVPVAAILTGNVVNGEPLGLLECSAMACCAVGLLLNLRRR